mmetsp:Transcript_10540/g.7428  ORF Transcript_10540/g.7428 Transcript_10540/m.7428 type:complete len:195 (-) Transcript_10540:7-591(-)
MAGGKKVLKKRAAKARFTFRYEGPKKAEGVNGKYYPAEDVAQPKGPTPVRNAPRLRSSIAPGTVVILLAGRFQGKRVVVLKQLTSGLLLVSGPYSCNGVPLRRVNQKYVIATSTSVPLDGVDVSKIDDSFFARESNEPSTEERTTTYTSAARKAAQSAVDAKLEANVNKVEMLKSYLSAKFTLSRADRPHLMKF